MKCLKCGCESWGLNSLYWRCVNCSHVQRAPGVSVKDLKEEYMAKKKELRDIAYCLKRRWKK